MDRLTSSALGVAVSTRALGLLDDVAARLHEPSVEAKPGPGHGGNPRFHPDDNPYLRLRPAALGGIPTAKLLIRRPVRGVWQARRNPYPEVSIC